MATNSFWYDIYPPSFAMCLMLVLPSRGWYLFLHPLSLSWSGDLRDQQNATELMPCHFQTKASRSFVVFSFYSHGKLLSRDSQVTKYTEHIFNNLGICLFIVLIKHLWDRIPKVGLLGQRVNAFANLHLYQQ